MRTGAVVRSDRCHIESRESFGRRRRLDPTGFGIVVKGKERHDRERRDATDGFDGRDELVEVEERLEHEQVDAAALEYPSLLRVQRPVLARVEHLELAERADRTGDQHVPARHLACLACEAHRGRVDRLELVIELLRRQLAAVGAERVRLDQLGTRTDVARVHGDDALGRPQVRLLGAPQAGCCAGEQRAHAAVGHDRRARAEPFEEVRHSAECRGSRWVG